MVQSASGRRLGVYDRENRGLCRLRISCIPSVERYSSFKTRVRTCSKKVGTAVGPLHLLFLHQCAELQFENHPRALSVDARVRCLKIPRAPNVNMRRVSGRLQDVLGIVDGDKVSSGISNHSCPNDFCESFFDHLFTKSPTGKFRNSCVAQLVITL
jgi:hypothetical protein